MFVRDPLVLPPYPVLTTVPQSLLPLQVEKWDCETIVSTYSNLDNHPSVLGIGHKARSKNRGRGAQARAEEAAATAAAGREAGEVGVVQLSEKTGLPIGVLPERTHSDKYVHILVV